MVEKDGIEGEEEVKKPYRAAREESDEKEEMSADNKVSSALIGRVESMLQKPDKETDNADAEIGDRSKILDRGYDDKLYLEEVGAAAMYLKDTQGKGAQELKSYLSKDKGDSKIVNILLKGSFLSNEVAENVKEESFLRAAKSGLSQQLKDTEHAVKKQDKTEIAKKEPDNSVVEKGGTEVEEAKKSYRAAGEGSDEKAEMAAANEVSSALIGRADSMLQKLESETHDDDAEIGDWWIIRDRGYDGQVPPQEVGVAAVYVQDTPGKGGKDIIRCLLKDKDCMILVKMPLKGSFLSNEGAKNVKERSMSTVPSLPEVEYGGRLGRVEQVPLAGKKRSISWTYAYFPWGWRIIATAA